MTEEMSTRKQVCDIGRRLYAKGFVAGSEGNISVRLSDNEVLCTPTLTCKGFVEPEDLCVVDLSGEQLSGSRRRTSEIGLHLEIYRGDAAATAVVHAHPPHATAFAVAREDIPSGILPEVEVFLGVVPRADYETPGGSDFAATIRPFVGTSNTVLLSNHGAVTWGPSLELAFWNTEVLDAYCRVLILARQLGNVERLPADKVRELLNLRPQMGLPADARQSGSGPLYVNYEFGRKAPPER